jgi:hypothetical protein
VDSAVTNALVRLPGGEERTLRLDPMARELVFGDTGRRGIYQIELGNSRVNFCVNLLEAAETDTTPRPEIQFGKYAAVAAATVRPANVEIWRWIALGGLAILMFEWWFYHKRTA